MATEQQSDTVLGKIVTHRREFEGWDPVIAQLIVQDPKGTIAFWQECLKNYDKGIKEAELLLLEAEATVVLSDHFIARDHLKVDTSGKAGLAISYLGENLQKWFMDKKEKVEEPTCQTMLQIHRLLKASVDKPIMKFLGGNEATETTLQEMFRFLASADKGNWYIFYIKDAKGVLRAVSAYWDDDGWDLDARSVERPRAWDAEGRVVSRKRSES